MGLGSHPRLWRLSTNEQFWLETALTQVRVLVSLALLVLGMRVPMTTAPFALQAYALGLYVTFAVASMAALRINRQYASLVGAFGQIADIIIGVGLLHFGTSPSSLVVLILALLGVAHRGGLRATMVATSVAMGLTVAAPIVFASPLAASAGFSGATLATAIAQCGFVLLAGAAIGYVTDSRDQMRSETEIVARAINHVDVRLGLKHAMAVGFDTIIQRFDAVRAVLVVREIPSDRVFLWQGATLSGPRAAALRVERLEPRAFGAYDLIPAADAWSAVRRSVDGGHVDLLALDGDGERLPQLKASFPDAFLSWIGPFEQLMGFTSERPGEWTARLFLMDPRIPRRQRLTSLRLCQRIVRRIGPAVDNASMLHRLRSRSAAEERMRISRELHDGIIQSVLGVEIQLHTLAGRLGGRSNPIATEVNRLAALLRTEVVSLRDMMQQMQPADLAPERLIEMLSDIVQRFQYETGIRARFISQFDGIDLSPRACREVTRVVQEALVNVRKHSGAASVFVRLTCADGVCRISIDDDGRGFPIISQLSPTGVDLVRLGPRVIKERVRLLGGDVTVESAPNQGARVSISIPLAGPYANAG